MMLMRLWTRSPGSEVDHIPEMGGGRSLRALVVLVSTPPAFPLIEQLFDLNFSRYGERGWIAGGM